MPLLNSGFIIGTYRGTHSLLFMMAMILRRLQGLNLLVTTQGVLDFVYYSGLTAMGNLRMKILPPAAAFFVHAGWYLPTMLRPDEEYEVDSNPIMSALGEPYAVVHMWDRWQMMALVEHFVLRTANIDYHFKGAGPLLSCNGSELR